MEMEMKDRNMEDALKMKHARKIKIYSEKLLLANF